MKKKKLTNREITEGLGSLYNNDQMLYKEIVEVKQALSLYLQYREEAYKEKVKGFNDFVKAKTEQSEQQQRSENKK